MLVALGIVTFYFSRRHQGPVIHYSQKAQSVPVHRDGGQDSHSLHATDLIMWNEGIVHLEPRQLKAGLNVVVPEGLELLDAQILNPEAQQQHTFRVDVASLQEGDNSNLQVQFEQMKKREGLKLRLIYSGERSESFLVEGSTKQRLRKAIGIDPSYLSEHIMIRALKMLGYALWYLLMITVVLYVVSATVQFVYAKGYSLLIALAMFIIISFVTILPPMHLARQREERGGPPWPYPFTLSRAPYSFED